MKNIKFLKYRTPLLFVFLYGVFLWVSNLIKTTLNKIGFVDKSTQLDIIVPSKKKKKKVTKLPTATNTIRVALYF